jgi:hypothetical protein
MARAAVDSLNDSELNGRSIHVREDKVAMEVSCQILLLQFYPLTFSHRLEDFQIFRTIKCQKNQFRQFTLNKN